MGCCSPNYRKAVNEQEVVLNEKGKDTLPIIVKVLAVMIVLGGFVIAFHVQ